MAAALPMWEWPMWVIAVVNCLFIPVMHFAVSVVLTRLPRKWFQPNHFWYRERTWEQGGRFYERFWGIRRWKSLIPDAAPWVRGFEKRNLQSADSDYLRTFIQETCRSELAHWLQIPAICLCLLWNPWPAVGCFLIFYSFFSNLPCILLQRFTRLRLRRLLQKSLAES
ncbi:MAG: hypothetical protein AAF236_04985 [Verrucomicrobiota bacterium]